MSRNQCEIYAILYEPGISHVYVRDRKSRNGTHVNGTCIGNAEKISSGYLLSDGDVVEIRPYWQFSFKQPRSAPQEALTELQQAELKVGMLPQRHAYTNVQSYLQTSIPFHLVSWGQAAKALFTWLWKQSPANSSYARSSASSNQGHADSQILFETPCKKPMCSAR